MNERVAAVRRFNRFYTQRIGALRKGYGESGFSLAEAQTGDDASVLELYRRALRIRRAQPELGDGTLDWLDAPSGALAFARDRGFVCIVNVSGDPVGPPASARRGR